MSAIHPADAAMDIEPDLEAITIEFSEALDPETVTTDSIAVSLGDEPVPGSVTYADATATFVPAARLSLLATYTVTVRSTIEDADGAPMLSDFSSEFSVKDGAWATSEVVEPAGIRGRNGTGFGIDDQGNILVVWNEAQSGVTQRIVAQWYEQDGGWGDPVVLDANPGDYSAAVAVAPTGDAVVVWSRDQASLFARQYRNGMWQANPPTDLTSLSDDGFLGLAATILPTGAIHVYSTGTSSVVAVRSSPEGVWTLPQQVNAGLGSGENRGSTPRMGFDANGNGIAVWRPQTNKV
ncbi:MAG TPA: Ig-like domain-containing protein, partial [Polyangiaceae bacterium]|nr:Ig-like domain-containing protein [Polyangiaceae bacterium]